MVEIVTQDIIFNGRAARLSLTLDVTKRVRMEMLLRKRQQEFSASVENAPDIITRLDRELRHVYMNPAMAAVTGLARGAFIGKTHRKLGMPEQLIAFWEQEIRRVFDSGERRRIEFECPCHGRIRYFEARMVPDFGLKGAVISRRFDGAGMSWILVREAEAVPLALVLNELVFNAQKHMTVGDGQRTIKVGLFSRPLGVEVCMTNHSDTFSSGATGDPGISWSPPWQ